MRNSAGFTLLEVLLAIMIMALTLTAIMQQFSLALRGGAASQDVVRAVLHAREKLAELKCMEPVREGGDTGTFEDGYAWQTEVLPWEYAVAGQEGEYEQLRYETFLLRATVTWSRGLHERQRSLETLKTVKKEQWKR